VPLDRGGIFARSRDRSENAGIAVARKSFRRACFHSELVVALRAKVL
jgi:hypothetical protein